MVIICGLVATAPWCVSPRSLRARAGERSERTNPGTPRWSCCKTTSGSIDLDAQVVQYMDQFLLRTNDTTLAQLSNTTAVNAITVRQLLAMRGGLDDYEDNALHAFSLEPATNERGEPGGLVG